MVVHAGVIGVLFLFARPQEKPVEEKEVAVSLMRSLPPPPPPPPPAGVRSVVQRKPTPRKEVVIRQPEKIQPIIEEKPKEPEPEPTPEPEPEAEPAAEDAPAGVEGGVQGGVEGGVVGGVIGGVVGGQLGGQLGGTGEEPVKPKNVPPFVIQRDVVRQTPPRLSEVFKQSRRGQGTLNGMYRICVSTDGSVYEVTPVKAVPGADEDIIAGIKEGWQYKPQKVPVCFLYNIPITIQ
ncbi:PaxA [Archangium violaceum]|uniref:PaxA n=1 Tax=Archangium violaceum TaxID=83451 RepID=UPI001EF4DCB3|nr:PaxA [Archangium violaceum]